MVEMMAAILKTVFWAMVPVGELRAALPIAVSVYHLPLWLAFIFSVIGNLLPVWFIIKFLGPVSDWLRQGKIFDRFFVWLFARTRRKLTKQYEKYGFWALAIFVAIPLPVTGAWTGALAAWLFGMESKRAMLAIAVGVLIAGVIVSLIVSGVLGFLAWVI